MRTIARIRREHEEAEEAILKILNEETSPKTARELVELAYERGLRHSSGMLRTAVWSLVDEERAEFTSDLRLQPKF